MISKLFFCSYALLPCNRRFIQPDHKDKIVSTSPGIVSLVGVLREGCRSKHLWNNLYMLFWFISVKEHPINRFYCDFYHFRPNVTRRMKGWGTPNEQISQNTARTTNACLLMLLLLMCHLETIYIILLEKCCPNITRCMKGWGPPYEQISQNTSRTTNACLLMLLLLMYHLQTI